MMMTRTASLAIRTSAMIGCLFLLGGMFCSPGSVWGEFLEMDTTGALTGKSALEGTLKTNLSGLQAPAASSVSILILYPQLDTPDRLRALGYQVTEINLPSQMTRSNLQNYDVLWQDVGSCSRFWDRSIDAGIQAWVQEDGGGVIVTQPNCEGWHATFPPGFEVYVYSDTWPGWPSYGGVATLSGFAHPITEGLQDADLPGNGDWVWEADIGASWDILAVDARMPDEVVALLAGEDGPGRWVYNNGNFSSFAGPRASNRFVNQMVCWAAQVPPPPPCQDLDGDGYGYPGNPNCLYPEEDCDDTNPEVHPGATEICDNGIDDNCNGLVDAQDPACGPQPWPGAATAGAAGLGDAPTGGPGLLNFMIPLVFALAAMGLLRTRRRCV